MRTLEFTCECGTKIMVRWPSRSNQTQQTIQCPDCIRGRELWVGTPFEVFYLDDTGNWRPC